VVNLIFLHRYILQLFPSIPPQKGRHPFNLIAHLYMASVIPLLILVVVPGVQVLLTSSLSTIQIDRKILRFAQCYLTVFVSIQVVGVIAAWTIYFSKSKKQFGIPASEVTIRALIILVVAALLTWIQAIKICQTFYTPGPETAINPPWYLRRPILYAGFFLPELICVILYAVSTIRVRFLKPLGKSETSLPEENRAVEQEPESTVVDGKVEKGKFEDV
jgi:hypothetical protein